MYQFVIKKLHHTAYVLLYFSKNFNKLDYIATQFLSHTA